MSPVRVPALEAAFKQARSKELVDDQDLVPPDRIEAGVNHGAGPIQSRRTPVPPLLALWHK